MADETDPWDWGIERVVQEFCTDQRTWTPIANSVKLPNAARLKERLEAMEIDGVCLLGPTCEAPDFFPDLEVKSTKHKEAFRTAIAQFRRRSRKYKVWRLRQDKVEEADDLDQSLDSDEEVAEGNKERNFDNERKIDSVKSAYTKPQANISESGTQSVPPTLSTPAVRRTPTPEEPVPKKRRIAPISLSADTDVSNLINVPQGNLVTKLELDKPHELQGAYLGQGVLNRTDIMDFSGGPLLEDDLVFEFHREPYPFGLRRQRARHYKRRLINLQREYRPAKADMVPGGDNPDHYQVLPAYGDSDDEYDSDTWKEIQEEEEQRKKLASHPPTELTASEKLSILDGFVAEKIAAWNESKLPALQQKANRTWNKARRQGLKSAIERENRDIAHYQDRLASLKGKILNQPWANEADMRKVDGVLDVTVVELQRSIWRLNLLKSPTEPIKLTIAPRQPKTQSKPANASDEDILTDSESDEDILKGFLINDEQDAHKEVTDGAGNSDDDALIAAQLANAEAAEIGLTDSEAVNSVPAAPGLANPEAAESKDTEDVNMADADAVEATPEATMQMASQSQSQPPTSTRQTPPGPPSNPASRENGNRQETPNVPKNGVDNPGKEEETIDLTRLRVAIKVENASTPSSKRGPSIWAEREVINLVTPEKSRIGSPALISFSPEKVLQPSHSRKHALSTESAVQVMVDNLDPMPRSAVLALALWSADDLWKGYVLPALRAAVLPKLPLQSKAEKDTFYALHLARLFDTFLGGKPQQIRSWFASQERRAKLEDQGHHFEGFVRFLRKLTLDYKIDSVPRKPPQASSAAQKAGTPSKDKANSLAKQGDHFEGTQRPLLDAADDPDATDSDDPPPQDDKKRKPTIVRNQQAINLREGDKRRVQEQEERKQAMRARLALLGDTPASQNMRLIINETKEDEHGFIYVPERIAGLIKNHQISGVRFMWNQVVVNAQVRQGCLLAHTMGLGKTMQIITLLMTIAEAAVSEDPTVSCQIPDDLKESRTLILAPPGLVNNWMDELLFWTHGSDHHLGEFFKVDAQSDTFERQDTIMAWARGGGVLVLGYEMFKKLLSVESLEPELLNKPNIIIADEAHMMKNPGSKLHQSAEQFKSHVRIALTGSPLANKVLEYHSMINWVAPNYLSDLREFRHDYATPIEEGLSADASSSDRRKALTRLQSLKVTVAPKVHRRTIHSLKEELPQKTEFVISVPLTELQRKAYEMYMQYHYQFSSSAAGFATLQVLALLCNHPACFRTRLVKAKDGYKGEDATTSPALPQQLVSDELRLVPRNLTSTEHEKHSWKVPLLKRIIDESHNQGDSVLIFSQSIPTLDYLENMFNRERKPVIRLDGKTQVSKRQSMVKDFNTSGCGIFLISTTAGGLGLNITGANRVVIFDFKYNPQHEQQAVGRAYRLGQTKPVFVYRLICGGTFEEKMQNKGIFKMQLASRVVDKKNPIPKAQRFEEMFAMPTEPRQGDLQPFMGKDKVLDAVLASEVAVGIRSIVMADTFEEENLEEEQLTSEETLEAKRLTEMHQAHQARQTGKPIIAPLLPIVASQPWPQNAISSSTQPTSTTAEAVQAHRESNPRQIGGPSDEMAPASGATLASTTVPALTSTAASVSASFISRTAPASPSELEGAARPSFQSGTVEPVLGATTQLRETPAQAHLSSQVLKFWDNDNVLKGELARALMKHDPDRASRDKTKEMVQQIATAFNEIAGKKDHQDLTHAKIAVVDSATNSQAFVQAVMSGELRPAYLASLSEGAIRKLGLKAASGPDREGTATPSAAPNYDTTYSNTQKATDTNSPTVVRTPQSGSQGQTQAKNGPDSMAQPERQQNTQVSPLSNGVIFGSATRKNHKDDDQAVLQELTAQRQARTKAPRLPEWAREAVASQGRSATSSSASPAPSAAPVRRARNPFQ